MEKRQPASPFAKPASSLPKFSVRTMLLMTAVFAVGSSVLVAALRTPDIAAEIAAWSGRPMPTSTGGHYSQLIFLLLCYCSTMLLAMVVQIFTWTSRWLAARRSSRPLAAETSDPFAEDS